MSYSFNGTNQNLTVSNQIVSDYPVTVASWSYHNSAITSRRHLGITNSDFNERLVSLDLLNGTIYVSAIAGGTAESATKGTYGSTIFFHSAGVLSSTTSRFAYLNGSAGTENTNSKTPGACDRFAIGGYGTSLLNGRSAEVAVWNVALTEDEITSLAKGFKPTRIRPQSLVFYAPLLRNLQDLKGALTITNNNTATVADHPRVY
jgi:hypothetical protein